MTPERAKEIKTLYARLLTLEISKYLITQDFNRFCIEYDIDDFWSAAKQKIVSERKMAVLIPGYTGDAEKAFRYFIYFIDQRDEYDFKEIITALLIRFAKWSDTTINIDIIKDNLI